jgi:hypothetical protein
MDGLHKKKYIRTLTAFPSGKHRQKKSGRGQPAASLTESVMTAVIKTAKKRPEIERKIILLLVNVWNVSCI